MTAAVAPAAPWFAVPPELSARKPPEERGLARDEVRLLVADGRDVKHARFRDLASFLSRGDVLVVNTSATIAAAVEGTRASGRPATVHFATPLDDVTWLVELRGGHGRTEQVHDGRRGERLLLPEGVELRLTTAYPDPRVELGSRLWCARVDAPGGVADFLERCGRPISYGYVTGRWPLANYQTVFANEPGSAEMPSAGRPFTAELVTRLVARGVVVLPVVLHAGVSSLEKGEPPLPERFVVPAATAEHVTVAKRGGNRIVAVGTTATRALESVATPAGTVSPGAGWTDLVLGPQRPALVVDGLITGFHEPEASHLLLLEAVAGTGVLRQAYAAALAEGYLWHEFGDSALLFRSPG